MKVCRSSSSPRPSCPYPLFPQQKRLVAISPAEEEEEEDAIPISKSGRVVPHSRCEYCSRLNLWKFWYKKLEAKYNHCTIHTTNCSLSGESSISSQESSRGRHNETNNLFLVRTAS